MHQKLGLLPLLNKPFSLVSEKGLIFESMGIFCKADLVPVRVQNSLNKFTLFYYETIPMINGETISFRGQKIVKDPTICELIGEFSKLCKFIKSIEREILNDLWMHLLHL